MNANALFKISYGLFILTAEENGFDNGCVINTLTQQTGNPCTVSVTVNKSNKTCEMIKSTGKFNVSVISENAPFELFRHFGFQSGTPGLLRSTLLCNPKITERTAGRIC